MTTMIELPLWLVVLALVLAAIAALERVLMPSARWFLRRRMERLVARLNTRLDRPIHPFRLMARQDRIVQLTFDPKVIEAVVQHAHETGVPEPVAFEEARRYAREIVPGFSALVYFGFATRAAKRLSRALYRVRVGRVDRELARIDPKATVIFVMNHRSNMDYVLVTWLVSGRAALSYAVGEWARVWPLSRLIRAMGAYFIRRGSHNKLYRRVLARYVQIATAEGVTQAVFPEGGLSLDGRVGPAKVGLLSYILQGFDAAGRDVVFVPVGISYDRVMEDRLLVEAGQTGVRRFRAGPFEIVGFALRLLWRMVRGRFTGYGKAAVAFGSPLSLRDWLARGGGDAETLGAELMAQVSRTVPILPVPLLAAALREGPQTRTALETAGAAMVKRLTAAGAVLELPDGGVPEAVSQALVTLIRRGIALEDADGVRIAPGKTALAAFYAGSVRQRLELEENQIQ